MGSPAKRRNDKGRCGGGQDGANPLSRIYVRFLTVQAKAAPRPACSAPCGPIPDPDWPLQRFRHSSPRHSRSGQNRCGNVPSSSPRTKPSVRHGGHCAASSLNRPRTHHRDRSCVRPDRTVPGKNQFRFGSFSYPCSCDSCADHCSKACMRSRISRSLRASGRRDFRAFSSAIQRSTRRGEGGISRSG